MSGRREIRTYRTKAQIADESLQSSDVTEKEGFEPSFDPLRLLKRAGSQHEGRVPRKEPS